MVEIVLALGICIPEQQTDVTERLVDLEESVNICELDFASLQHGLSGGCHLISGSVYRTDGCGSGLWSVAMGIGKQSWIHIRWWLRVNDLGVSVCSGGRRYMSGLYIDGRVGIVYARSGPIMIILVRVVNYRHGCSVGWDGRETEVTMLNIRGERCLVLIDVRLLCSWSVALRVLLGVNEYVMYERGWYSLSVVW